MQQSVISSLADSSSGSSLSVIIYSDEVLYLGRMYSLVLLSPEAGISFNKLKHLRFFGDDSHIQKTGL